MWSSVEDMNQYCIAIMPFHGLLFRGHSKMLYNNNSNCPTQHSYDGGQIWHPEQQRCLWRWCNQVSLYMHLYTISENVVEGTSKLIIYKNAHLTRLHIKGKRYCAHPKYERVLRLIEEKRRQRQAHASWTGIWGCLPIHFTVFLFLLCLMY